MERRKKCINYIYTDWQDNLYAEDDRIRKHFNYRLLDHFTTEDKKHMHAILNDIVEELDPREKDAILLRYRDKMTFQEIGEAIMSVVTDRAVTQGHARQIVARAIRRIDYRLQSVHVHQQATNTSKRIPISILDLHRDVIDILRRVDIDYVDQLVEMSYQQTLDIYRLGKASAQLLFEALEKYNPMIPSVVEWRQKKYLANAKNETIVCRAIKIFPSFDGKPKDAIIITGDTIEICNDHISDLGMIAITRDTALDQIGFIMSTGRFIRDFKYM